MQKITLSLAIIFIYIIKVSPFVSAQGLDPEHLMAQQRVSQVSVSPDGAHVAYTLIRFPALSEGIGTAFSELYLYDVQRNEHTPVIEGKVRIFSIGWFPDGNEITFRQSTEDTKGSQVFAISPDGEKRRQLTDFPRSVRGYDFIDNSTLAVTAIAPQTDKKSTLLKQDIHIKIFEEELRNIDLWHYNIETGEKKQLTHDITVFDFDVCPEGKKIAAAIAPENTVDASYMFKRVHILEAKTGELMKKLANPGKLTEFAWSPDGKKLAFRAASKREDAVSGSIFIYNTEKKQDYKDLENYVNDMELSAISLLWKDNDNLLFASEESVDITIRNIDVREKDITFVMEGGKAAFSTFDYHDAQVYFGGHTAAHPRELMRYTFGNDQAERLSFHNDWLDDIALARQEKIIWKARDGMHIEGVLIYPLNYDKNKQYPLITYIHGGPEAAVQDGWLSGYSHWGQFAAARDFFVFYPNYRASSGRGVDFTMEGYNELLGTEYNDVLDGIDHLVEAKNIDPERVGIGGGSYGGYFAAWSATKHTEKFAASVVFVGVTNQISKRNITDIPWEDYLVHWGFWTYENFEKVWEASPVKYAHQSKTPTLILHGEDDPRIPISQSKELFRALKIHSDAPVRLVIYPGEGHGNRKNVHRFDYLLRTLDWFEYYLIDKPGASEKPPKYYDYTEE